MEEERREGNRETPQGRREGGLAEEGEGGCGRREETLGLGMLSRGPGPHP